MGGGWRLPTYFGGKRGFTHHAIETASDNGKFRDGEDLKGLGFEEKIWSMFSIIVNG